MMIRKKTARAFPLLLAAVFVLSSGCSPAPPAAFEREETADVPAQREETILAEREETIPAEREETVPAGQEEAESEKASEEEGSVETEACSAVRLRTGEGDDVRIVLDAGCFLDFLSGKDGYTLQIGSEGQHTASPRRQRADMMRSGRRTGKSRRPHGSSPMPAASSSSRTAIARRTAG